MHTHSPRTHRVNLVVLTSFNTQGSAGPAAGATMAEKYGCPENRASLGRAGWSVLHSMAATYPENPTPVQQSEMQQFISVC